MTTNTTTKTRLPGKPSLAKFQRERARYVHISKPLERVEVDRMVVTDNGIEFRKVPELQVTKLRGISRRGKFPKPVSLRRQRQYAEITGVPLA